MIEGKLCIDEAWMKLTYHRNSQPLGRGTQNYDCLCWYWNRHWIHFSYSASFCGWSHRKDHRLRSGPSSGYHPECHSEQGWCHLPADVRISLFFKSQRVLTFPSFPLVCMLFATTAIMTTSSRMCYAFARYVQIFSRRDFPTHIL